MFRALSLVSGILCLAALTLAIGRETFLGGNSWSAYTEGELRGRPWALAVTRGFNFNAQIGSRLHGIAVFADDRMDEALGIFVEVPYIVLRRLPVKPWGYAYQVGVDITVVAGLLAILPCVALFRAVRARRLPGPGECVKCRYLLRGLTSDRCPECGTPFDSVLVLRMPGTDKQIKKSAATPGTEDNKPNSADCVPVESRASGADTHRSRFHQVRRLVFLVLLTCVMCYPPLCVAANLFYVVPPLYETLEDDTLEDLKPDIDRRAIGELDQDCRRAVIGYVMRSSHWVQGFARLFPDAIHCLRGTSDENTWWTSRILLYGRYQVEFTTSTAWTDRERCELALAESFDFHVRECVRRTPDPKQPGEYIYDHTGNVLSETFSRDEYEAFLDANGDFGVLGIELTTDEPIPYCDTGFEDMKNFFGAHCVD